MCVWLLSAFLCGLSVCITVTEKVYETDSTDATDEETAPAAKRPRIAVPKPSAQGSTSAAGKPAGKQTDSKKPAAKAKQSSLMSFFKK